MGGAKLIHAGCWAHASRYFFQAVEAHPDDRAAIALVATIDELFAKNAIRPVALGRKNWIHFGSQDAGPAHRRDPLYRRNLSSVEDPDPRLSRLYPARSSRLPGQTRR